MVFIWRLLLSAVHALDQQHYRRDNGAVRTTGVELPKRSRPVGGERRHSMFGKAVKLFQVFGFTVKADASWLVIVALVVWSLAGGVFPVQYPRLGLPTYLAMAVIAAAGLFLSVVIHELCHSLVARRFGLAMKGITLFIFGGVAEMADEPPTPKAEFWMAIAGPIASFVIAGVFYALAMASQAAQAPPAVSGVLFWIGYINGLLAIFNLIPGFPLDGGRVLRSILWHFKHSLTRATAIAAKVGATFGLILIGLGIVSILLEHSLGGLWWILIGWFVRSAARQEYQGVLFRQALYGEPVRRFMNANPVTVDPGLSLSGLVEDYIYRYHFKSYPVVHEGHMGGCVGIPELQRVPRGEWSSHTVAEIATPCSPENTIGPDEDAMVALNRMSRNRTSRLLVVEDDRLAGIVSLRDLMQFLGPKLQLEGADDRGLGPPPMPRNQRDFTGKDDGRRVA
jgi:Zn-dependent protease/CBS domain-containing protein